MSFGLANPQTSHEKSVVPRAWRCDTARVASLPPSSLPPETQGRAAGAAATVAGLRAELAHTRERLELAQLELEQTQAALAKLSLLFTKAAVPIVVADADGTVTDINPAAEERYGCQRRAVLGRPLRTLVPAAGRAEFDGLLQRCRGGETVRDVARFWLETGGDEAPDLVLTAARTTLSPIRDKDGILRGVVLADDLHELLASTTLLHDVNQDLQEKLLYDPLTEVGNRRLFERDLDRELARAARQREPLSVLMIDVDRFKSYNDEFGHLAGDACLRRVGRCVASVLQRKTDVVARWGGEEFAVLLPRTDAAGARRIAEAARKAVHELHESAADLRRPVTASVGVATVQGERRVARHVLLSAADAALYAAKANGRDRVEVAAPLAAGEAATNG